MLAEIGPSRRLRVAEQPTEEALARRAEQHRTAERVELTEAVQQLDVVLHRLAEADARVDADALFVRCPAPVAKRQPLLEERHHLRHDIVVSGLLLHRPRLAEHVHEAEVGVGVGHDVRHLRVTPQGGDVVHELGPERRWPAVQPPPSRCRSTIGTSPSSRSSTGTTRRSSSSTETPSEPGRVDSPPTSTIAAPSSTIRRAEATAIVGIEVHAAVGERIRRDVEDAHDRRARKALLDRDYGCEGSGGGGCIVAPGIGKGFGLGSGRFFGSSAGISGSATGSSTNTSASSSPASSRSNCSLSIVSRSMRIADEPVQLGHVVARARCAPSRATPRSRGGSRRRSRAPSPRSSRARRTSRGRGTACRGCGRGRAGRASRTCRSA